MSNNTPTFRWANTNIGGPRSTSKLPYGPLSSHDRKKMGLVNGVCPSMGSMYCFSQCDKEPSKDCPVVSDGTILAGEDTTCGTPCQTCMLVCPCKVQEAIAVAMIPDAHCPHTLEANLAEQEARMLDHLHWWDAYCITVRKQS